MKKLFILLSLIFSTTMFSNMAFAEIKKISVAGAKGDIELEIELNERKIVNINILNHNEAPRIGGEALDELIPLIIAKQSYNVDSVVGATITSEALKKAVKESLEN